MERSAPIGRRLRNGQQTGRRERLRRNRRDDAAGGGVLPPVLVALARRHEQHRYALRRVVSMPASLGYDHEVPGPKGAQRLALRSAHRQTCRASENVEQLVAGRVQLPGRTALEAGGGAVAPWNSKGSIGLAGSSLTCARSTVGQAATDLALKSRTMVILDLPFKTR